MNMDTSKKRFHFVLSFLVLLQQFNVVLSHNVLRIESEKDEETLIESHNRQKRWAISLTFGQAVGSLIGLAMVGSITFDIIVAAEGCDAIKFLGIKDLQNKYASRIDEMDALGKTVRSKYIEVMNAFNYASQISDEASYIYELLTTIDENGDALLYQMNNDYRLDIINKTTELLSEVTDEEIAIETYDDLEIHFTSVLAKFWPALYRVKGFITKPLIWALKKLGHWALTNAVVKQLIGKPTIASTAVLKVGTTYYSTKAKMSSTISKVKTNMFGNKAGITRATKVLQGVIAAVYLGLEIRNILTTIGECQEYKEHLQKAIDNFDDEIASLKRTESELLETEANITATYKELKDGLYSIEVLDYVNEMRGLLLSTEDLSEDVTPAIEQIDDFIEKFPDADYQTSETLTKNLYQALSQANQVIMCLTEKLKIVASVSSECRAGGLRFETAYDVALAGTHPYCKNQTYLDMAEVKAYVQANMEEENLQGDCILNNMNVRDVVCMEHLNGVTATNIATNQQVTEDQVQYFLNICPKADVTSIIEQNICSDKLNQGHSLHEVLATYHEYDASQVETTYEACVKDISPHVSMICMLASAMSHDFAHSHYQPQGFTEQQIQIVINSCSKKRDSASKTSNKDKLDVPVKTKKSKLDEAKKGVVDEILKELFQ